MFLIGNKRLFPTDPVLGAMVGAARPTARLFWEKGGRSRLSVLNARGPVASSTAQGCLRQQSPACMPMAELSSLLSQLMSWHPVARSLQVLQSHWDSCSAWLNLVAGS